MSPADLKRPLAVAQSRFIYVSFGGF